MNAVLELAIVSFLLSLAQNLLFKKLSNQVALKDMNAELLKLQKQTQEARKAKNYEAMEKIVSKLNEANMQKMNLVMKPNLLSSFIFIFAFVWIQQRYATLIVTLPLAIPVPVWGLPPWVWTSTLGWLGWYLLTVLAASVIIRDLFEIHI